MSPDGSGLTVVRDLGTGSAEGAASNPKALCAGPDGALYGIVRQLGAAGAGVFRFTPTDGAFAWIQVFDPGVTADSAALLVGTDGLLYGAIDTAAAKTLRVFRLAPAGGGITLLHTLTSTAASFLGTAALAEGADGRIYGATTRNGAATVPLLFRVAKDGTSFLPLHDVNLGTNPGTNPPTGLLATPDGRIYGASAEILFRCEADGSDFRALHTFPAGTRIQRPLLGFDGMLYGVLPFGGAATRGALFRLATDGSAYEEFAAFPADPLSGQAPLGFLVTAPDGAFAGITVGGGDANRGTLFRVATAAQLVGIAPGSPALDAQGRFGGLVIGPPARPVDLWRSDDLQSWTILQRITDPQLSATFLDPATPTRPARFYRATAP